MTANQNILLQKMQTDFSEMAKDLMTFQFNRCLNKAKALSSPLQKGVVKDNFVRKTYEDVMRVCCEKLSHFDIDQTDPTVSLLVFDEARMVEVIYQYHLFHTGHLSDEKRAELQNNNEYKKSLIDEVSEYLTAGTMFESRMPAPTVSLSPDIWAYSVVSDRFLLIHLSFQKEIERYEDIIIKLMQEAFSSVKGIAQLLAMGQNTCAVTLWRHLHEVECISLILTRYGKDATLSYFGHQRFMEMEDDDPNFITAIKPFEDKIKKNKTGFKNYGWLLSIPDFIDNWDSKGYRLDMRKGLQKFAQLNDKETGYIDASKILHSTALMLSIEPEQYYIVTMELLYDTTLNIIDAFGNFICKSKLLRDTDYSKFRTSVEGDAKRLNENIEIIRLKFPQS